MSHALDIHDGKGQIARDPGYGILIAYGETVPANGTIGYSPGCIFIKVDGTTLNDTTFINTGTRESSNFVAKT